MTWKGWYPVIESQLDYGGNPYIYKTAENIGNPSVVQPALRFMNVISLPLVFSSGNFSEYIRPSFTWEYMNQYIYIPKNKTYDSGQSILTARFYFSNYSGTALRDIYPRWAQIIDLNYTFSPFDKLIYGTSSSLKTAFYFPGILPNNGIKLRFEKEKQIPEMFLLGSNISFPRGYNNVISTDLNFLSVDYVLPLFYPDFNISGLLYLKRIRTGLFYDYGYGKGNYYYGATGSGNSGNYYHNYYETFSSYGFELLADFHLLRIPFQISGGIQTVWKQLNEKPVVGLLFNIDLFGLTIGKRTL